MNIPSVKKLLTEPPLYLIQVIQGDMTYGSANETGIFTGVNVKQNIHHQNLSMLYEVMVNNTINKNGVEGASGVGYKIAAGPACNWMFYRMSRRFSV